MMPSDMKIAVARCSTTYKCTAWDPLASASGLLAVMGEQNVN